MHGSGSVLEGATKGPDASDNKTAPWHASGDGLVGREVVLDLLQERLSHGRRVACVLGGPGVGKTAVISVAAQAAEQEGWMVVRVQGRVTESMLGLSALLDLLDGYEVQDRRSVALTESLRARLQGPGEGVPDALQLRREVRQWLIGLAGDTNLLVVIDDVQWLDLASWLVLAFIANRLEHTRVSFLVASRSDTAPVGIEDQPTVHLQPLTPEQAVVLLDRSSSALDPAVRTSILERAAGNPLALCELGRVSRADALVGRPGSESLPATVESAFAADLPHLPTATRRLLLLVAAGADDIAVLSRATSSGSVQQLLEPAQRAGLVRMVGTRVAFRHPLIGSTVYDLAGPAKRRAAHATLAEAYVADGDRQVWHRAAAAVHPDEGVAAELMAVADRMRMRGALQEAASAVIRAAELTEDPDVRDQRVLAGVEISPAIGDLRTMINVAERLRQRSSHPVVRARSALVQAYALTQTMDQVAALDMLQNSLEELIDIDVDGGWRSLTSLATLTYRTGRGADVLTSWLERYESVRALDLDEQPLNVAARAWIRATLDPLDRSAELRTLLRTAPDAPPGSWPVDVIAAYDILFGATGWLLDEHVLALQRLSRAARLLQRSGNTRSLAQALMALGQVQFDLGLYDGADHTGQLIVDMSDAGGLLYHRVVGRELRARIAAVRGDHVHALKEIDALLALTDPGRSAAIEAVLLTSRAHALVGLQDHEGAFQDLRALFRPNGEPVHVHVSHLALPDLVAAAVRVGRADEVTDVVRCAEARLGGLPGQRTGRLLARAQAQLVNDESTGPLFEYAIHGDDAANFPFEQASAELEYGTWLRRRRRTADARRALSGARRRFIRLGATSRAEVAETELRAAGVRTDDSARSSTRWAELTAQEREIVLLAATGLSNKEIGQALFLSPRTVGAHLYHAFPKLGVTSRTQLRDVVNGLQND